MKKGQNINDLMDHINNDHKINIDTESQKTALLNMGYFHSYKAYRFIHNNDENKNTDLPIDSFNEIEVLYELDNSLKTLIYPKIMKIETAIKNRVISCLVADKECSTYSVIEQESDNIYNNNKEKQEDFNRQINNLTSQLRDLSCPCANTNITDSNCICDDSGCPCNLLKKDIKRCRRNLQELKNKQLKQDRNYLSLRTKVDKTIASDYKKDGMVAHYIHHNKSVPLWAYFELISLGDLSYLIKCLSEETRTMVCKELGIYDGRFPSMVLVDCLYLIKDLRNAVAHNHIIFDARFRTGGLTKKLIAFLSNFLGLEDEKAQFNSITDYMLLICNLLLVLGFPKAEYKEFLSDYKKVIISLKNNSNFSNENFELIFTNSDIENLINTIDKFN